MKKLILVFGLAIAGVIIACQDQIYQPQVEHNPTEYLVFGDFYGNCEPCQNTMYRVTRTSLTFDVMTHFPGLNYQFSFDGEKDNSDFSNSMQLLDLLPEEIKNAEKQVYGCPDCADQGGYYFEFLVNGEVKRVILDTNDTEDQSEDMIGFKNVVSIITQIIGK